MADWYYETNGERLGPVGQDAAERLIVDGTLDRGALVWTEGMEEWAPVEQSALAAAFDRRRPRAEAAAEPKPGSAEAPRSLDGLWAWFRFGLVAFVAIETMYTAANLYAIAFFQRAMHGGFATDAALQRAGTVVDLASGATGLLYSVAFFYCIVLYCRFFQRAMRNVRIAGAPESTIRPAWAWGWHFVPFANLWMPLRAVRQIWRASSRLAGDDADVPALVGWWWAFWIVTNGLGNVSFRMGVEAGVFAEQITDLDLYRDSLWVDIASSVVGVPCSIMLLVIAGRIRGLQNRGAPGGVADVFA